MTELTFAKSFLSSLDARPIKLQADYATDLKTFEPKFPYTLPRNPHPMHKPSAQSASASTATSITQPPTTTVLLKSLRNPPLDLQLKDQALDTSIHDLKQHIVSELGLSGTEGVKVLYKKRPCADSKTIKDVVGDEGVGEVDFSIMIMGGTPTMEKKEEDVVMGGSAEATATGGNETGVAQGKSGMEVLETEEFWDDLRGFLVQRLRDEATAGEVWEKFKGARKG